MKNRVLLFAFALLWSASSKAVTVTSAFGYFQASYSSDCTPATVTFTQLMTYPGATSKTIAYSYSSSPTPWSGASINHTYSTANTYDVYVNYFNGAMYLGYDYVRIEIYGQPGNVYNVYGATSACPNDKVRMRVDQGWSPSTDFTYTWNWGDGSPLETSDYTELFHTYTSPGTYNITVTTTGGPCGGSYVASTGSITIGTGISLPSGMAYSFWLSPDEVCPMEKVYMQYPDEYASSFVQWGDGSYSSGGEHHHSYTLPGHYTIVTTITNGCGSSYTYVDTVTVRTDLGWGPYSYLSTYVSPSTICPGSTVHFSSWSESAVSQQWHDSNGNLISNETYFKTDDITETDTFYVTYVNGCGADTTLMSIVEVVNNIPINPYEVDNLMVPASACTGGMFPYSAEAFGEPNGEMTYTWNFGDGTPAQTGFSGTHKYATSGTYNGTLYVVNTCGMDSTINFTVTAGAGVGPDPSSLFYFAPGGGDEDEPAACPNDDVLFVGVHYVPEGTFTMDFGDGTTSSTPEILNVFGLTYLYFTHSYSTLGVYNTSLTYTNACGLSLTKTMDITIKNNVESEASAFYDEASTICLGDPLVFHGYGANQFIWNFGDGTGNLVTTEVMGDVPHVYANPGSYVVTVQAKNGCGYTATQDINVVIPDNRINITTNTIDATCGMADGKAIGVVSGGKPPYAISWSSGDNGILVDSLTSGIYVCNVTDQNGCYNFGIATVSDAEAPAIVVNTVVDVTCNGGHDGAIDINVIGSSGPYHYSWSNGKTTEDLSGLVAGPYEVYVTDAYGCTATASITVDQPDLVQLSFLVSDASCGDDNGTILASANGNSGPFTYVWSDGHIGANYTGLGYGIYEVNVIDSKGCVVTKSTTVDENNGMGGPAIALMSVSNLDCEGAGSTIDISVFATTGTPTYSWSNGANTQDITVTAPGEYTVTVTDGICHAIETFTVTHAIPAPVNICMVSVDSMYAANKVIWEKPVSSDIHYFKIYRESSSAGLYYHVGSRHYDSLSIWTDYVSNPQIQSWRYKISAVDHCGSESVLSPNHKTIHLNQNIGVTPGTVNLIWDDYEGFNYNSFDVLRYTATTGYVTLNTVSSLNHSYTDNSAPVGDPSLFYLITVTPEDPCVSTRAQNNNTVRSNRSDNALPVPFNPDGIEEQAGIFPYSHVYPNPAGNQLTVEFEVNRPGDYTIQMIDALGQQVISIPCGQIDLFCKKEISLNGFDRGIYFVNIVSAEGRITKRIIKM